MERLPIAPMLGRMLLTAEKYGCVEPVARIAAGLLGRTVFVRPRGKEDEAERAHARFRDQSSDTLTLLNAYRAWEKAGENGGRNDWARESFLSSRALREIEVNSEQLMDILEYDGVEIEIDSADNKPLIRKAVAAGLIVNVCVKTGLNNYSWHDRHDVYVHPGSVLFQSKPKMMVCSAVVETTKVFARDCTAIEAEWLTELLPASALEVIYQVDGFLGHWRLEEVARFQGLDLSRKTLETIPESAMKYLVAYLLKEMIDLSPWRIDYLHPQSAANRKIFSVLQRICGLSRYLLDDASRGFMTLAGIIIHRRLDGIRTLAELQSRDIALKLEEVAPPQFLTACQNEMARLEEAAVAEQTAIEQANVKIEERVKQAQTFRQEAEERQHQEAVALSEQIWTTALRRFPRCPLCGGEWETKGKLKLSCHASHDEGALVVLEEDSLDAKTIGRFYSDRDELVAFVIFEVGRVSLSFAVERDRPWYSKKFKSIRFAAGAVVLPASLIGQCQQILEDLSTLRNARQELTELEARLEAIRARSNGSSIKKLSFITKDGRAVAVEGGVRYEAVYGEPYPCEGETWYCRFGKTYNSAGLSITEVFPEIKVGVISCAEDIKNLADLIRETYPGLPDELFV